MTKLSMEDIQQNLKNLTGWKLDGDAIKKEWKFKDFSEAMQFINKVSELAEQNDHHPELFNIYNQVSLRFSTHDAGGLTKRDFNMASKIDKIKL